MPAWFPACGEPANKERGPKPGEWTYWGKLGYKHHCQLRKSWWHLLQHQVSLAPSSGLGCGDWNDSSLSGWTRDRYSCVPPLKGSEPPVSWLRTTFLQKIFSFSYIWGEVCVNFWLQGPLCKPPKGKESENKDFLLFLPPGLLSP